MIFQVLMDDCDNGDSEINNVGNNSTVFEGT
jgi:hypothetical protein